MFMAFCFKQAVSDALDGIVGMKTERRDPLDKNDDDLDWRTCEITKKTVQQSAALMQYLLEVLVKAILCLTQHIW